MMRWTFVRLGGVDQAAFRSAEDVLAIPELDQKLWIALACPIEGLSIDRRTLELIDTEKDGRIRAGELIEAIRWLGARLADTSGLEKRSDSIALSSLKPEVQARLVNVMNETISLAEIQRLLQEFASRPLNGDGVVTEDSTQDAELKQAVADIVATVGGEPDRSGKPGVNRTKSEAFFGGIDAIHRWMETTRLRVEAGATVEQVRSKIDDYFARCKLAAFDPRATAPLNRGEPELLAIAAQDLGTASDAVAKLPLARIEAGRALPIKDGINPAWRAQVAALDRDAIVPLLGDRAELDAEGWAKVVSMLPPASPVTKLGSERIRALASSDVRRKMTQTIDADLAKSSEHGLLDELERLARYQRDLKTLAENFVSFTDFYHPTKLAACQAGRLLMDGRAADLCVPVEDIGKHATLNQGSNTYLAYCELVRRATGEKRSICAAFTNGTGEALFVGRNGIFYDRAGKDWDATIVKTIEAPISLREAFWSPWRKIGGMIEQQINKILAAREAAAQEAAATQIQGAPAGAPPAPAAKPPEPAPASGAAIASAVAAVGIALGFLSTAVATVLGYVAGMPLWKTLLGIVGVVLLVSGPSVAIAYLRLRRRDLAPILNASGWAINRTILLSLKLGRKLTQMPMLPKGARRDLRDPYADSKARWRFLLVVLLLGAIVFGAWWFGFLDELLAALR